MDVAKLLVAAISLVAMPVVMSACSTFKPKAQVEIEAPAVAGDAVRLFHGGSKTAKEEFCVGAVVTIYRPEGRYYGYAGKTEVGKVKMTKDLGMHYMEGVVVEGKIMNGDSAQQSHTACLIRVPGKQ